MSGLRPLSSPTGDEKQLPMLPFGRRANADHGDNGRSGKL
jgi:hypothetical protein